MKWLIRDHLNRWWWVWLTAGVAHGLIFVGSAESDDSTHKVFSLLTLQIIYFAGVFPLSYDLQRGHSRALLALPVSIRQMARAWWFVSVGLPALLLAAAAGLAMLIHSAGTTNGFHANIYLADCLTNTLWLGTAFCLLTASSGRPLDGPAEYARRGFFLGFLFLCLFGVVWAEDFSLNTKKGIAFLSLAAVMSIAGWFRAEHLVRRSSGARAAWPRPRKGRPQYQIQAGFGGLPFLAVRMFTRCLLIGLLMIVLMVTLSTIMPQPRENSDTMNSIQQSLSSMGESFQIWWMLLFQLFPTIMHIRFLRTLPLSVSVLAATLVLVPTAAILCLGGFIALLAGTGPASGTILSAYLTASSIGAVSMAVLVWRGVDRDGMALFMFMIFFGSIMPKFFHADKAPPLVTVSAAILLIALAFEITRRVLIRSSHAYRAPPFNAWGMTRWRP